MSYEPWKVINGANGATMGPQWGQLFKKLSVFRAKIWLNSFLFNVDSTLQVKKIDGDYFLED